MSEDNAPPPRRGRRQRLQDTAKDLPPNLYKEYKSDPDETYQERKTRTQWIQRYWSEEWFFYHFITPEYSEKCAKKAPWGDILFKKLEPQTLEDTIARGFYPCMVRPPLPENAHESSLQWIPKAASAPKASRAPKASIAPKASKPSKSSKMKTNQDTPPESSVHSEDVS
jgi:hypothetical protein